MEASQFLERFRLLSREIQISLQNAEKKIEQLKKNPSPESIKKVEDQLDVINENWSIFSGWVLLSTLDDVEEARRNSVSGFVDVKSKIARSKKVAIGFADKHGVKINIKDTDECQIKTYISYFEQFLDLIFLNAVKYSPKGYTVEVFSQWKNGSVIITVDSFGPLITKQEMNSLGVKGFRSENAVKTNKPGDGYGLFNIFRLSNLLNSRVKFISSNKNLFEINGIPYSDFSVQVLMPSDV